MGVRVYIEGGGDSTRQRRTLRRGFAAFFAKANSRPTVIMCGSRDQAHKEYFRALRDFPEDTILLLVDSEGPVPENSPRWQYLRQRDGWDPPPHPVEDHCHSMVQLMETWLVADPEALAEYYRDGFASQRLPHRSNLEEEPKADVVEKLRKATERTTKREYRKIEDGAELLARIDPAKVRTRAPHCNRLLGTLQSLAANQG